MEPTVKHRFPPAAALRGGLRGIFRRPRRHLSPFVSYLRRQPRSEGSSFFSGTDAQDLLFEAFQPCCGPGVRRPVAVRFCVPSGGLQPGRTSAQGLRPPQGGDGTARGSGTAERFTLLARKLTVLADKVTGDFTTADLPAVTAVLTFVLNAIRA